MSVITVVAVIQSKPESIATVREGLQALVTPTRQEKGCLNYDFHQSIEDQTVFVFHENWESQTALQQHMQTEHFTQCFAKIGNLIENTQVYQLNKID